jgi:archaellum component FlaC
MEQDILQLISTNYSEILPQNRESLLLLVWLNHKIENGDIEEEFTTRDFEEAIEEVADFLHEDKSIQKETLSKKISSYFYETIPKGKGYRIQLTVYTKDLCKLLVSRIEPEILKLELIHTFKRTLPLNDKDLKSIQTLKYWFDNHFLTARNQILQHTEVLQQTVEERINELRTLLNPNIENPKELIGQFDKIFEDLAKQATGLANTIDFKNETLRKIKATKSKFSQDTKTFNQFDKMQREVDTFFDNISRRISGINEKIQLASKRLRNLLDTLRHKQQFKINLEKFLQLLLLNGKNVKGEIVLPASFPRKQIPSQQTKYVAIPKIDFQLFNLAKPERPEVDKEFYQRQKDKNLSMLKTQEQTAKWLDKISEEVKAGNEVKFEEWMDEIIETENNLEVPIQVCYGLILGTNKNKKQKLIIEQEKALSSQSDLQLWKMKIQPTRS